MNNYSEITLKLYYSQSNNQKIKTKKIPIEHLILFRSHDREKLNKQVPKYALNLVKVAGNRFYLAIIQ